MVDQTRKKLRLKHNFERQLAKLERQERLWKATQINPPTPLAKATAEEYLSQLAEIHALFERKLEELEV
jgi:hypothetical protein